MKIFYQYMAIIFDFQPTSIHLHPLQVENCDSNSRLVVDEDDNGKFRLERVKVTLVLKGFRGILFYMSSDLHCIKSFLCEIVHKLNNTSYGNTRNKSYKMQLCNYKLDTYCLYINHSLPN